MRDQMTNALCAPDLLVHLYCVNAIAEHMLDSNHPEPDQRGKNSLASKYFSGLYHTTQTENKEPISISSPEAEEKHNLYAYTRKRCRNPYGAKTWSKKARTSQTEEIGSDEDAAEAPPTSFVTASHKLVILFDIILA